MNTTTKNNLIGVGIVIALLTAIIGLVFLTVWALHDPYRYNGVYCEVDNSGCRYRNKTSEKQTCPEFWDVGGWDVHNLKLREGSCRVEKN